MRAKIKTKLTIPVVVEVHTEWDRRARQCIIVGGAYTEDIPITARSLYTAINPAEFHTLDTDTHAALTEQFEKACEPYREKLEKDLPEEELRGPGTHPKRWANIMKWVYGAHLRLPVPLVLEGVKRYASDIVLEPVLNRVPTVYIWNVNPAKDVLDKIAAHTETMKSPQAERLEEGCLRLRWTR